jgi:WD40 repeat protein/type II secretory pathway predicted ATPase ExeA/nitrate/nitrite transporter NarK
MHPSSTGRYHWVILALVMLAQFLPPLVLFSLGALAPLLRDSLSLSHGQVGFLAALFSISAALFAIPSGWGADKLGIRGLLSAVQVVGGLALVATAWLRTYGGLCLVMFLAGMTFTTVMVITSKAIAEWFPRGRRSTAMGAKSAALVCAGIVAGAVMLPLALGVGWRQAFAFLGGLMLASACCDMLLYRDRSQATSPAVPLPVAVPQGSLWRNRNIWRLTVAGFFFGGVQYSFTTYLALFLYERWGVAAILASSLLAQAHVGAVVSHVPYGWLSDRWLGGDCKAVLQWVSAVALGVMLLLLLLPPSLPLPLLSALVILYGLSGLSWGGLYQTLSVEISSQVFAGVSAGIATTLLYLGNFTIAPLFGYMVDVTGSYTTSWRLLMLLQLLGIVLLSWVRTASMTPQVKTASGGPRDMRVVFQAGKRAINYRDFYALQHDPFSSTATPDRLFLGGSYQAAFQALIQSLQAGQACVTLLGEPGLGKTFLLHAALAHSDLQHLKAIHIFYPKLSADEIMQMSCWELGCDDIPQDSERLTAAFYQAMLAEHEHGRQVVLIIDEADTVPVETLECLLWLAKGRAATGKPLLQIVLAGLPAFRRHGNGVLLRSVEKSLVTRLILPPLTYTESLAYIRHRVLQVGADPDTVFTVEAMKKIARCARGNPRIIDVLCTNLLIKGFFATQKPIAATMARDVIMAYRGTNASARWRRGVAYAAGVLAVAGVAGTFHYDHRAVSERGSPHPWQLAHSPHNLSSADTAPQPVEMRTSPPLTALSAPPPLHEDPPPTAAPDEALTPSVQVAALSETSEPSAPPEALTPTQSAPQMAGQDVSSSLEIMKSKASVGGPEPPAVGPERPTPVVPSQPARVAERPQKSHPRRDTLRHAAVPPLSHAPSPPRADNGVSAPASTIPSETRATAVVPERSTALRESPPPAVPPHSLREPDRFNSRAAQQERRATRHGRDRAALAGSIQRVAPVSPVGDPGTRWPEGAPHLVVETGGHVAMIRELLFTADGRELVSISDDKTIRVWAVAPDGRQATLARTIRGYIGEGREGMLAAATLSPPEADGRQRWLAVGGILAGAPNERYAIRLHDYASGEVVALLCGHSDTILALAFAPAGRWLASAGKDGTIHLWDLSALQGQTLTQAPLVLTGHTDHIYDLAWSATGERLASASYDRTVGLWNMAQLPQHRATLVARLHGHDDQVQTVTFHPSGTILVSGGKDQTVRLWQAHDGAALGVFARLQHKVSALAFAPDGTRLLVGNFSPPQPDRLTLLAYPSGKTERVFTGHQNVVVATAFHPSGQWVATGGGEHKEILLWQVHTGAVLARLEGTGRTIYAVGFSPDGRYLSWGHTALYTSPNHQGPLEHRFDLTQLTRLPGGLSDASPVQALERLGTLSLVLEQGGPYKHNARLHVQEGARRLSTIERGHADGYRHSAYTFTPDGQGVLSGGLNGVLRLYARDGTLRGTLIGHTGEIKAVAVSADGRWALSGANDQTLCLWSLPPGIPASPVDLTPNLTLFPAQDGEWVAWTPEGHFVASTHGLRLIGANMNHGLDKTATYIAGEQLRERFYRPALIQEKLHGEPYTSPQNTVRLHTDR